MLDQNTLLLYVEDPIASAAFYQGILGKPPVDLSPGFALFILPSGLGLGLWKAAAVTPAVTTRPGANDLAFKVDRYGVDQLHLQWLALGVDIALPPTDLDFGRSFVAHDPDGHRLRVYAMHAAA